MPSSSQLIMLPDMLLSIAEHIQDDADISRLSRCCRLYHELFLPLLFHDIRISLKHISVIRNHLQGNTQYSYQCRSLRIEDFGENKGQYRDLQAFHTCCRDLWAVLRILGKHGNLRHFSWIFEDGENMIDFVPTYVWSGLASTSSSLQELEVAFDEGGVGLPMGDYPKLRRLRLYLRNSCGWDCRPLQRLLNGPHLLEELCIHLPMCCGPFGLDFSSTLPRLRSFELTVESLPEPAVTFLKRHPTLECLSIQCEDVFDLGDDDLPRLKALCVDRTAYCYNPALFARSARRPIKHLRLKDFNELNRHFGVGCVREVASELHCLEIVWSANDFRRATPRFAELLQLTPNLLELGITIKSHRAESTPGLGSGDLLAVLASARNAPALTALRLSDANGEFLPSTTLKDLGNVPPTLQYIVWDVQEQACTYSIVGDDGAAVAVETAHPRADQPRSGWTGESVLDHVGGAHVLEASRRTAKSLP